MKSNGKIEVEDRSHRRVSGGIKLNSLVAVFTLLAFVAGATWTVSSRLAEIDKSLAGVAAEVKSLRRDVNELRKTK